MVRIRDCRLGLLHFTLMFGVFCYIGIYSILIQQRYKLKAIDIVGSTRLQLRPPAAEYSTPPSQSLFCGNGTATYDGPDSIPFPQFPCRYIDQYDAVDPGLEAAAIFIASRITETGQTLPPNCDDQPTSSCAYMNVGNSSTYYVGDVEMMTLLIDHSFSSATLGISRSAMNMAGQMLDSNDNVIDPCAGAYLTSTASSRMPSTEGVSPHMLRVLHIQCCVNTMPPRCDCRLPARQLLQLRVDWYEQRKEG